MGVDCIHVYPFLKIFLLFWVLEYSIYSVFCFRIFCRFRVLVNSVYSVFRIFRVFRHFVPSFRQSTIPLDIESPVNKYAHTLAFLKKRRSMTSRHHGSTISG